MRKPRDYGALADTSHRLDNGTRMPEPAAQSDVPSGPSRDGHFYGTLRVSATKAKTFDPSVVRASEARLHPITRSWTQRGDLVAQQHSANRWAKQSNQALGRQAELRAGSPAPTTTAPPSVTINPLERTPMAVQPHYSDSIFGMADELEAGMSDVASGVVNEVSNAAPEPAAANQELDHDPETAQLMESAEAARAQEAAQALEVQHEQEQEHDYE